MGPISTLISPSCASPWRSIRKRPDTGHLCRVPSAQPGALSAKCPSLPSPAFTLAFLVPMALAGARALAPRFGTAQEVLCLDTPSLCPVWAFECTHCSAKASLLNLHKNSCQGKIHPNPVRGPKPCLCAGESADMGHESATTTLQLALAQSRSFSPPRFSIPAKFDSRGHLKLVKPRGQLRKAFLNCQNHIPANVPAY